jgi:Membrane domain of glycerophosphoryl diester phosphodiesterase
MRVPVLRPLSLGEVLDTSFGVYRQLFAQLIVVSLATQGVPLAIGVYVEAAGGALLHLPLQAVEVLLALVLGAIGTATTTFMVAETYLGGNLTTGAAFQRAIPFLGRVVGTTLLVSLVTGATGGAVLLVGVLGGLGGAAAGVVAIGIATLVAIPLMIYVFCALLVATPSLVLEDIPRPTRAMGRSLQLTRGARGRIFAALLVIVVLLAIPAVAIGVVVAQAGAGADQVRGSVLVALAVTSLLQVLVYPFFYVYLTVIYYDLRVRKEGFDLDMLATSLLPA